MRFRSSEPERRSSRGFTLIEVLAGLVILGLIITSSLAIFYDRQKRLQAAEEMVLAWQALANEAEVTRKTSYHDLHPGPPSSFQSDTAILSRLKGAKATVRVEQTKPAYKTVTLSIVWNDGAKRADLRVIRSRTGGGELW